MARVSLARARPIPLASAPLSSVRIVASSVARPRKEDAAGSSAACVHSLSKGAPTPAPSTGDASLSLLYSRSASALCGARARVQKSSGRENGATSSRSATPHDHDLRRSIAPAHRAAVSMTPRAHPLPVPLASSRFRIGSTPAAGERRAGWSASSKNRSAGHAWSRRASATALASAPPRAPSAQPAARLATVAAAATRRSALRLSLVRNGNLG